MDDVTYLPRLCPRCGKALAADAPEDLCPACLLAAGTETLTQAGEDDDALTVTAHGGAAQGRGDAPQLAEGATWGSYRIGRLLGRGGMGEVHEAEHVETGRRLALKVLRGRLQDADERARFLREGQLAASVSHPHTVYIFGSEEISGVPVISMELLPGGTLKDRVAAGGPLPVAEAVAAVLDIIGGLDAAQAAGILHRDIKPSNCFVDTDGSVKVGDFGLSISTLARDVHQQLAGFEGTPQYAAPEQLRGEPLDVRADIYAVGATLHYLLTGQPPFEARDLRELAARVTSETARSPRLLRPDIPAGLATVILRCLSKTPAERPPSYTALADLLRPYSAISETPAAPRLRMLAGLVDILILSAPYAIWNAAHADITINGETVSSPANSWTWLLNVVYFFVLEARWGASLGKRLFGLRLSSAGNRPRAPRFGAQSAEWAARVARRTIVFHLPWLAFALLAVGFGPIGPARDRLVAPNVTLKAKDTRALIESAVTLTLIAGLFLTARRRNGWAGLHDLASGTRVVSASTARLRTRTASVVAPAGDAAIPPRGKRYGPFVAATEAAEAGPLVAGFDPVLRRRVWIHVVPPRTPPIDPRRRDVSRAGRLHWLTGRRAGSEHWDAYEALDGQPLLARTGPAPDWAVLKSWLLDLATELVASAADGSTPPLRLDRLWIRDDGRLVLLDFPAPGPDRAETSRASEELLPAQLLASVAGQLMPTGNSPHGLMPLSARTLLRSWSRQAPASLLEAHDGLVRVAAGPDRVRRARRALPLALASIPPLFIVGVTVLVVLPTLSRFFGPDATEMLEFLEMLYQPTPPAGSRLGDPEVRRAMETYVVGRHGARLTDSSFWDSPLMQNVGARLRPTADDVASRHPSVSRDDLAQATATITPELDRQRQRRRQGISDISGVVTMIAAVIGLLPTLFLSILSSMIVPGGLFTRMLGHAVVASDGLEIGRLLSFARALVAWVPAIAWVLYLAASPKVQGFVPTPPNPLLGALLTLAALGVGVLLTVARPSKGPHDWLLGTWVVPR